MKLLTEKTQIAKAMNFGKYPVLDLNLENEIKMCGKTVGYRGCKVRVPWEYHGETLYDDCELAWYEDSPNELKIGSGGCCLKAQFGYGDIMEMLENANSPILDKNQKFILIVHTSKIAFVAELETTDWKNINCMTVINAKDEGIGSLIKTVAVM